MIAVRSLAHDPFPPAEDRPALTSSRRQDGWSAASQRRFLEAIAEGHSVEGAARSVGLSAASAYAFRRTARGAAFALGWRAASMVAREFVAATLMSRALDGQVETVTRDDGTTVTRHRYDNRLALGLLTRLDRQVETMPDGDAAAARLVAQEFDAFLDLVERDVGPAHAGLFLARRGDALAGREGADLTPIYALAAADRLVRTGVATAAEVDVADLDPTRRAEWTAEQWARAEAAGMIAIASPARAEDDASEPQESQHSTGDDAAPAACEPVWWDHDEQEWRTHFPPPPGFMGREREEFGHVDYDRSLTPDELALFDAETTLHPPETCAALRDEYAAWLASLRASAAAAMAAVAVTRSG